MIKVDKYYIDDSKSGGKVQFKTDCPACPDAGKQKHTDKPLSVNQLNKTYNCHRCGWHGSYEKYEEGYKNNFKSNTVEEKEFTKPTITNMTNLSQEHVDYMFLRGIKQVTLKRNKIFTGEKNGIANDWINFPYYDSEELINVKSRKSKEKKFMQVAGANHIMYKLNDIRGEKSCIISEGECFTSETEFLTDRGWIACNEILETDLICCSDDKKNLFFDKSICLIKKEYNDDLVLLTKRGYSHLSTKKHKIVLQRKNGNLVKVEADSEISTTNLIPRTGVFEGEGLNLSDDLIRLYIAISADFTIRKEGDIYGAFKKERKIKRIIEILDRVGVRYTAYLEKRGYTGIVIHRHHNLNPFKLFPMEWINILSKRQIDLILKEIIYWDGNSVHNRTMQEFSSKYLHNVTFIQTLCHLSNITSTIVKRKNQFGEWYKVSILHGKTFNSTQKLKKQYIPYNGFVYCVQVKSGKILVRHNNHISISGNCEALVWEEVGFKNGTSVSQGAPNINDQNIEKKLACVYNCFDVFESMEIIYLACDNDPNGKRLEKELIRIFGEEKVRIIDFSVYTKYNGEVCKDANDVLLTENGKTKLLEAYNNAKEIRKEGVFTANDFRNEILSDYKIGQPRGTTTYVKEVDRIYTHRRGEVNLWTGYNNDGKSLMLRYLLLLKAKYEDWKIGMYVPEDMPLAEFYTDLIEAYQGKTADRIYEHSENFMSEETLLQGLDFVDKHFYTVYPENDKTIDELLKRFSYMIRKYNLSAIVFDPYNQIEHLILNGQREDLYISTFMSKLKTFAVKHNICLHLVAHQVTPKLEKSGKFPKPNRYSIKGGGTFSDKADNVLLVWRENRNEQGDTSVTLISDKIKKRKLTGNTGETTFNFDWKKNRYIFGGYDPMESPTTIGANENVWKAITPNSMFEEITYEEQIQNTQLTDYDSKGDLPF